MKFIIIMLIGVVALTQAQYDSAIFAGAASIMEQIHQQAFNNLYLYGVCQKCRGNKAADLFVKGVQCIKDKVHVDLSKAFQEFPDDQQKCVQKARQLSEQASLNTKHRIELVGACLTEAMNESSHGFGKC